MAAQAYADLSLIRRRRNQEALELRIVFIPRGHKLLAAAAAVIIVAAGIWGIFGSIPSKVQGSGMIVRGQQQIAAVQGLLAGKVDKILFAPGQTVEKGQVLIELEQPLLDEKIYLAEDSLTNHQNYMSVDKARLKDDLKTQEEDSNAQVESIREATAVAQQTLDQLIELYEAARQLERQGTASQLEVLRIRHDVDSVRSRIADYRVQAARVHAELAHFRVTNAERLDKDHHRLIELEHAIHELKTEKEAGQFVRSPVTGVLEEIRVSVGQVVGSSDVLMTVASGQPGIDVLAFLHPQEGPRAASGMPVHIVPSNVRKAEFGTVKGEVKFVSEQPVSVAQIDNLLRNTHLTTSFMKAGEPYLAWIRVIEDPKNPSGLAWWTGSGAPFEVPIGTLADVEIVVREQAPISLVVPLLREWLNL